MCYVGFILAALKTRFTDGPILDFLQYFDIHLSAQVTYIQYIFYILVLKYISDVGYCWHRGPQSAQFAVGADIQSNHNIHALRNIWICKLSIREWFEKSRNAKNFHFQLFKRRIHFFKMRHIKAVWEFHIFSAPSLTDFYSYIYLI